MSDLSKIYEAVDVVAKKHGAIDAGFRAIHSMSTEIGFHHWHHTIRSDDTPFEANLSRTCNLKTSGYDYIGKQALLQKKDKPLKKRLVTLTTDPQVPFYGNEVIWRNGERVGFVRSADMAFSLQKNILHGYLKTSVQLSSLNDQCIAVGEYAVERNGRKYAATIHLKKPFDGEMKRLTGNYDQLIQKSLSNQLSNIAKK